MTGTPPSSLAPLVKGCGGERGSLRSDRNPVTSEHLESLLFEQQRYPANPYCTRLPLPARHLPLGVVLENLLLHGGQIPLKS